MTVLIGLSHPLPLRYFFCKSSTLNLLHWSPSRPYLLFLVYYSFMNTFIKSFFSHLLSLSLSDLTTGYSFSELHFYITIKVFFIREFINAVYDTSELMHEITLLLIN